MKKFYGAKEIVENLGISRKTLDNWVESGDFPPPIKIGRRIFWQKEVVDKYLKDLEEKG
jgi:predicted DNA-binding transcriptional regulator AlpA